jgi:ribosomal protein S18 acetylase RimI-like enzyme
MSTDQKTNVKSFHDFIHDKKFIVGPNKFQLFVGNILVAETGFNIETPDEWFDEKYVTLYDLKTFEKFRGQGFAKYLVEQIFVYVTNELHVTIITLILEKTNVKATNLYFKCGFEIFMEYDTSYCLIKRLT